VRVSSASDLPRPWQRLGGLSRLQLFPLSGASGLPSRGLWIPCWFRSSSLCVDVRTLYPALRDASRLPFCTDGNSLFLVNTRSQSRAIGEVVALVALLSGSALSPGLLGRYGRYLKGPDTVSVPPVRTSRSLASLRSPASHAFDPLAPYCYVPP